MWVCKNLATGEYLTGRMTFDDHEFYGIIEPTRLRDMTYEFSTMPEAAEFAYRACEEFGLEGFEPVSDDPHWMGRGQE